MGNLKSCKNINELNCCPEEKELKWKHNKVQSIIEFYDYMTQNFVATSLHQLVTSKRHHKDEVVTRATILRHYDVILNKNI